MAGAIGHSIDAAHAYKWTGTTLTIYGIHGYHPTAECERFYSDVVTNLGPIKNGSCGNKLLLLIRKCKTDSFTEKKPQEGSEGSLWQFQEQEDLMNHILIWIAK